ncbi:MAG: PilZ domain-containing protein [Desulfobulbaceae bacterium]|nr:PilZ domain-containing protein [Desulfobulbaceae bacterium]
MKKTCLTTIEDISAEIDKLINQKIGLFCLRENKKSKIFFAKGKTQTKNGPLFILNHPFKPACGNNCLFYYHLQGQPLRGFLCRQEKHVGTLLGLHYPDEIFEIQRRKYPRLPATKNSTANFALLNRQKFFVGRVEDISLQGARISGNFPVIIAKGDTVTPITLRLFQKRMKDEETEIHIPEAEVVRVSADAETTSEIAIHFTLQDREHKSLMHYIDIRTIEETN